MIRLTITILLVLSVAACGRASDPASEATNIVAEKRASVTGPGRCGIKDAWSVSEAAGVRLSTPALMNMRTAEALDLYLKKATSIVGKRGGGLVEVKVVAHYACRTRNNRKGAKLSEHALGNAIDIAAYRLADGTELTVLDDWRGENASVMRALHAAACGPFGTVLGPKADRHHQDHFHFDTAAYRSGPYCR